MYITQLMQKTKVFYINYIKHSPTVNSCTLSLILLAAISRSLIIEIL